MKPSLIVGALLGVSLLFISGALAQEEDACDRPCDPQHKTLLCHVPPGDPANTHTICIDNSAVAAHLGNHAGDHIGCCDVCGDGVCDGSAGESCGTCPSDCGTCAGCCQVGTSHCFVCDPTTANPGCVDDSGAEQPCVPDGVCETTSGPCSGGE